MTRFLVTGTASFMAFQLKKLLMAEGCIIHCFDGMVRFVDVISKYCSNVALIDGYDPRANAKEARSEYGSEFVKRRNPRSFWHYFRGSVGCAQRLTWSLHPRIWRAFACAIRSKINLCMELV